MEILCESQIFVLISLKTVIPTSGKVQLLLITITQKFTITLIKIHESVFIDIFQCKCYLIK